MDSLVVGYGNDLRTDDGAGRVVADRVDALGLPGVTVRSVMQLTPELALEITKVARVVFVDASVDATEVTLEEIVATPVEAAPSTHYATPASLLGMTATVGPVPNEAYAVSIPVTEMGLGFDLTPATAAAVDKAVALLTSLLTTP